MFSCQCVNDEGDSDCSEDERGDEANDDDPGRALQHGDDDLVHQLVKDDQALNEEEGEGSEGEVYVERNGDTAANIEEAEHVGDENTEDVELETNLSNIVRVETTASEIVKQ